MCRQIDMNKAELITSLAEQTGQTRAEVTATLDALMETVSATLAQEGGRVVLVGFGTFDTRKRAARPGRNPQTGEPIQIAEATLPRFTPGKLLRDRVVEAHKPKVKPKGRAKSPAAAKAKQKS